MGKVKLNLVSGAVVEKPLINAFKANNNSYVVLDNEVNGSMGLPIILVCKLENNKLIKILDQNEWGIVKEYLKNIIAGNQIELIKVDKEIAADDIYYTQLTLPVPSFDALKNAYKIEEENSSSEGTNDVSIMDIKTEEIVNNPTNIENNSVETVTALETPPMEESVPLQNPVEDIMPTAPVEEKVQTEIQEPMMPDMTSLVNDINAVVGNSPVIDIQNKEQDVAENNIDMTPMNDIVMPSAPVDITPVNHGIEINENTNIVNEPTLSSVVNDNNNPFKEQKEAFMQACENMFDALVQKFERELENRK